MPLTPASIWQALRDAEAKSSAARQAMTEATEVLPARTHPAGRVAAHRRRLRRAYDESLLYADAGAASGVHPRRFQCQLYGTGAGIDRIQRRLRRAANAGRLPGGQSRRPAGVADRPVSLKRQLCHCGHRRLVLDFRRDVRRRRPRQHRLSPVRLFAVVAPYADGSHRPGVLVSTALPAWSARPSRPPHSSICRASSAGAALISVRQSSA